MGNHHIECDYCGRDTRGLSAVRGCDTQAQAEKCYAYQAVMAEDRIRRVAQLPSPSMPEIAEAMDREEGARSTAVPEGYVLVPIEPGPDMWDGLARQIVMWLLMSDHSGKALHAHLKASGRTIPDWLVQEIPPDFRSPAKGTIAVVIYRAMIERCP